MGWKTAPTPRAPLEAGLYRARRSAPAYSFRGRRLSLPVDTKRFLFRVITGDSRQHVWCGRSRSCPSWQRSDGAADPEAERGDDQGDDWRGRAGARRAAQGRAQGGAQSTAQGGARGAQGAEASGSAARRGARTASIRERIRNQWEILNLERRFAEDLDRSVRYALIVFGIVNTGA